MKFKWKQVSATSDVFYDEEDGKIYGKVLSALNHTSFNAFFLNMPLGEYMSLEQAKKAIENPNNFTKHQSMVDKMTTGAKP